MNNPQPSTELDTLRAQLDRSERRAPRRAALACAALLGLGVLAVRPGTLPRVLAQAPGTTLASLSARISYLEAHANDPGPKGPTGDTGAKGPTGDTGTAGTTGATGTGYTPAVAAVLGTLSLSNGVGTGTELTFTGVNVHILDGTGTPAIVSGYGNLIVGYNELSKIYTQARTGSHNIIVGAADNYLYYGGIVAGYNNSINGPYATVTGGSQNLAKGNTTSISGGSSNLIQDDSVEQAQYCTISGGSSNQARGNSASVSGGYGSQALNDSAWAVGTNNYATGNSSAISGGSGNYARGYYASVSGGGGHNASGSYASVSGGYADNAQGTYGSVSGGRTRTQSQTNGWKAGSEGLDSDFGTHDFPGKFTSNGSH